MAKYDLVFDGDCGFCRYTVDYARALTGEKVRYRPYQEVHHRYPDLSAEDFKASIWLFGPDGLSRGADAAYRTLAIGGRRGLAWCYRRIPGFAAVSEGAYTFVSKHRAGFHRLSRLLFGRELRPARFVVTAELAARLIGLTFLMAFWSYAVQVAGLNGSAGIQPIEEFLAWAEQNLGASAYWHVPSVFWLNHSDAMIQWACWAGVLLGAMATLGFVLRFSLLLCFLLYLSLQSTTGVFMSFQWDLLLLEAGFIGLLAVGGRGMAVWLARLTVFRFMFMSGMVKWLSGDPSWRDYTALDWHFFTQPLPNPLSWYFHNSPEWFRQFLAGGTLFVEIFLPVLIFMPRRIRQTGAVAFIALELMIGLTGNYNFFNFLTIVLCLFLFDDRALARVLPERLFNTLRGRQVVARRGVWPTLVNVLCVLLMISGAALTWARASQQPYPELLSPLYSISRNLRLVGGYGPFAVMTRQRDEIVIEGSSDGLTWKAYELPYKPDALNRMPVQVAPHQPRVDWQLWFAALSDYRREIWFQALIVRLLEGSDAVEDLFSTNPFHDQPPQKIRARLYRYRFTTPEERRESGDWWVREERGLFLPESSLNGTQ